MLTIQSRDTKTCQQKESAKQASITEDKAHVQTCQQKAFGISKRHVGTQIQENPKQATNHQAPPISTPPKSRKRSLKQQFVNRSPNVDHCQ